MAVTGSTRNRLGGASRHVGSNPTPSAIFYLRQKMAPWWDSNPPIPTTPKAMDGLVPRAHGCAGAADAHGRPVPRQPWMAAVASADGHGRPVPGSHGWPRCLSPRPMAMDGQVPRQPWMAAVFVASASAIPPSLIRIAADPASATAGTGRPRPRLPRECRFPRGAPPGRPRTTRRSTPIRTPRAGSMSR